MLRWQRPALQNGPVMLILFVVYSNFELEVDNKHTDSMVLVISNVKKQVTLTVIVIC